VSLGLNSCEDPIEIDIPDGPQRLVVEGWITDQFGPYTIRLTLTNNFNDGSSNPIVEDAQVIVTDSENRFYTFSYQSDGNYVSDDSWRGEPGLSYRCQVLLPDGTIIRSTPELLQPVPSLDSLFFKEVFPPNIIEGIIQEEFFIGSTIRDPADVSNFYRWRLSQNGLPLTEVSSVVIFSDRFVNGNEFQIEVPQILFGRLDTIVVRQESISELAFDYFDLLIAQATTLGQSSGTAPAVLRGNLTNPSDPEEIILGYFGASAVVSDTIIIVQDN